MQPGSYCRIIDARCARLKIFLKEKFKKKNASAAAKRFFLRSSRTALFCWRPLVRFNRLEQTEKKKKRWTAKCFPALCYLSIWGRIFVLPLFPPSFILDSMRLFSRFYSTVFTQLLKYKCVPTTAAGISNLSV